ncbi:gamma-glutamylcyclotransferase family protein [Marinobacteraceae bacterium S3BR75-40.1]
MRPCYLFCYGTLQHPPLFEQVAGERFQGEAARLDGYRCARVIGEPYPAIVPDSGAVTHGTLVPLQRPQSLSALDAYEGPLYQRQRLNVEVDGRSVVAWVYVLKPAYRQRLGGEPWSLETFQRRWASLYCTR